MNESRCSDGRRIRRQYAPRPTRRVKRARGATIDFHQFKPGSLILFSEYDFSPGFQATITGVGQFGRGVYDRLPAEDLERLDTFARLYDNGAVVAFAVG